jgi:hypothetical protein
LLRLEQCQWFAAQNLAASFPSLCRFSHNGSRLDPNALAQLRLRGTAVVNR